MRKFGIFTFVNNAETLTVSNEVKNEVKDMFFRGMEFDV